MVDYDDLQDEYRGGLLDENGELLLDEFPLAFTSSGGPGLLRGVYT